MYLEAGYAMNCRIRDLNDEINKLIREKGHWERRIVELGGPNYARTAPRLTDDEGNQVQGATGKGGGYKYFGAAKQLPGVRELFEKEAPRQIRRTRHQMYRHIDADYYGFRDDEDGVLVKVEGPAEKKMRTQVKTAFVSVQPAVAVADLAVVGPLQALLHSQDTGSDLAIEHIKLIARRYGLHKRNRLDCPLHPALRCHCILYCITQWTTVALSSWA